MVGMSEVPELTTEQRRANLQTATLARQARKALLDRVRGGEIKPTAVLDMAEQGDETALRLPVKQLLKAIPGIGEAKARYLMRDCQIADSRRVRGLGSIKKRLLRERLG